MVPGRVSKWRLAIGNICRKDIKMYSVFFNCAPAGFATPHNRGYKHAKFTKILLTVCSLELAMKKFAEL